MSGDEAIAAWKRLCEALPRSARKQYFGLSRHWFNRLKAGRSAPGARTLKQVVTRYGLDPDYILRSRPVLGFTEEFPMVLCRARYARVPEQRLQIFAFVVLAHYLELRKRWPEAVLEYSKADHADVKIAIKNDDHFLVAFDAAEEIILTLKMNLGQICTTLQAAQDLPHNMKEFCKLIDDHKRRCLVDKINLFEEARKQSQEYMS